MAIRRNKLTRPIGLGLRISDFRTLAQRAWIRTEGSLMITTAFAVAIVLAGAALMLPTGSMAACNDNAPTLEIEVNSAPIEWRINHEATLVEINHGEIVDGMISLGDTAAALGVDYDYKAWGPKPGSTVPACPSAKFRLDVSANPVVIRIGREVPVDSCAYEVVREHERRHVQVYEHVLERAPAELKAALEQAEAAADEAGPDQPARLQGAAAAWLKAQTAAMKVAHEEIDTAEEYARVSQVCKDLLAFHKQ
jgi:hypothetical protein